jgi:hypothetical protein
MSIRAALAVAVVLAACPALAADHNAPPPAPAAHRTLTFEDRVAAQRAIEQVYWNHRVWPKDNPGPKPPLSAEMSDDAIRARVQDYLNRSIDLERIWLRPIRADQLQAELERIATHTQDGRVLHELFAALGNDPLVIAETLARQTLVDRLIRECGSSELRSQERILSTTETPSEPTFSLPQIDPSGCSNDAWIPTTLTNAPARRTHHTAVWTGAEMIVWGGIDPLPGTGLETNTGGRYKPATDSWSSTSGMNAPTARYDHTAVWTGTEMIIWGAAAGSTGGRYNPATDTWTPTSVTNVPTSRSLASSVWTGTEMIVWGGNETQVSFGTGGRYKPATDSWTPTPADLTAPTARTLHTAVWTGNYMIVWGGYNAGFRGDGRRYDPVANSWTAVTTANAPSARGYHSAVWTGIEMIIWGGYDGGPPFNDGARYNPGTDIPGTDSWSNTSLGGAPIPRKIHTAVWTGSEMIVWGGLDSGSAPLNSGGRYAPTSNSWVGTSTGTNVPSPRTFQTAVWSGTEMIVWAGVATSLAFNSGGRYCACPSGMIVYRDADADGYGNPAITLPSCDGSIPAGYVTNNTDCDDTNPSIHPGATEVCNGLDDDCDGVVDGGGDVLCDDGNVCTDDICNGASGCVHTNNTAACSDGNPCTMGDTCSDGSCVGSAITAPPETHDVAVAADKATYSWSPATFATQYDVVRGKLSALPVGPGGDDEACFDNLPGTMLVDSTVPDPSTGFWYLSRGENACGIGTFGSQSDGFPRITTTCP